MINKNVRGLGERQIDPPVEEKKIELKRKTYFVDYDSDGNWYVVDASKRALWEHVRNLENIDEELDGVDGLAVKIDDLGKFEFFID